MLYLILPKADWGKSVRSFIQKGKNDMKKIIVCLAVILAFTLVFVACNKDKDPADTSADSTSGEATESTTPEETPTDTESDTTATTDTTDTDTTDTDTTGTTGTTDTTETSEWEGPIEEVKAADDGAYAGNSISESSLLYTLLVDGGMAQDNGSAVEKLEDGTLVWKTGGFGAYYRIPKGKYVYTMKFYEQPNTAAASAFIRGNEISGWDSGLYGEAGAQGASGINEIVAHGDSGIYYYVTNGNTLVIIIKSAHAETPETTCNVHTFTVKGVSNEITVVDLEDTIYFKSGELTCAKIVLEGSKDYDMIAGQVEKATVSVWGEEPVVIENALISKDIRSSRAGVSWRNGAIRILSASFGTAENITYNKDLDTPLYFSVDKSKYEIGTEIPVVAKGEGIVALYLGEERVMYYKIGAASGFKPNGGEGITIENQGLAALKEGNYTIKLIAGDKVVQEVNISLVPGDAPVTIFNPQELVDLFKKMDAGNANRIPYELKEDYVTFKNDGTISSGDYNSYFASGTPSFDTARYFAFKYRTTSDSKHEIYLGTKKVGWPKNLIITKDIVYDGEWHTYVIDLDAFGIEELTHFRIDLLNSKDNAKGDVGATMDVAWMGFFSEESHALNYGKAKVEMTDTNEKTTTCDTYYEDGAALKDDKAHEWLAANRKDGIKDVKTATFRGWLQISESVSITSMGYCLDGYDVVMVDGATSDRPDVVAAGFKNAKGYQLSINLTDIPEGEHSLEIIALGSDGKYYRLARWGEITIVGSTAVVVPEDWKDTVLSGEALFNQIEKVNNPTPDSPNYLKRKLSEDKSYITFTVQNKNKDRRIHLTTTGEFKTGKYFAFRYRSENIGSINELWIQAKQGEQWQSLNFQNILKDYGPTAGEWGTIVIDISKYNVESIYGFRIDILNTKNDNDTPLTMDIEWMGFFMSEEDAKNYKVPAKEDNATDSGTKDDNVKDPEKNEEEIVGPMPAEEWEYTILHAEELYNQIDKVNNPKPDSPNALKKELSEDKSYITFTVQNKNKDRRIHLTTTGEFKTGDLFAFKFRSDNIGSINELFLQTEKGTPWKNVNIQNNMREVYTAGEWCIVIIDISKYNVESIYGFRIDILNTKNDNDTPLTMDIAWMGFFKAAEPAVFEGEDLFNQIEKVNNPKPDSPNYLKRELSEDKSYVKFTVQNKNKDRRIHLTTTGGFKTGKYFAFRYRSNNIGSVNELYIQTYQGTPWQHVDIQNNLKEVNVVGEWCTCIVDISKFDVYSIYGFRIDILNTKSDNATELSMDIAWMGFFDTVEAAQNYGIS